MRKELLLFPFHLIVRPFAGFWDLKYEARGNWKIAGLIVLIVFIGFVVQNQYGGFIVNSANPEQFNSLVQLRNVLLPFFLWSVANWSLTTLMDGEGKFSEICIATAYATMPLALILIPNTILSIWITREEIAFYFFFNSVAFFWFLFLLFVGTMTVHQYTVTKTLVTILLTLVGMGFLLFLGLLFFSLIQQMFSFVFTIYQEIVFRN